MANIRRREQAGDERLSTVGEMPEHVPSLAEASKTFAVGQLLQLIERWLPELRLPRSFAGHSVGSDVAADLAFTLASLLRAGVREVAGLDLCLGVTDVLERIVGDDVRTFWSYRVAESLLLFGEGRDNEILSTCSVDRRGELERACDPSVPLARLGKDLPTNYAFVLARCEQSRTRLGLAGEAGLHEALGACNDALTANERGFVDDSPSQHGRYDLYLIDSLLFAEPLADLLAPDWEICFRRSAGLCRALASPSGELIGWGRSNGVLSIAATVQVAATAIAHGLTDAAIWEQLGIRAIESLAPWFDDGLVNTHRRAGHDRYRGEARWLQLTLDVIGKVATAAQLLRDVPASSAEATPEQLFPDRDELHRLSDRAAVWSYRRGPFAFTVPFVAGPNAGYLAVPNQPGSFEMVADSDVALMTPAAVRDGRQFVARGLPAGVRRTTDGIEAVWNGFKELDGPDPRPAATLRGRRQATFSVRGRSVAVEDSLTFEAPPDAVVLQAADTSLRACVLSADGPSPARELQLGDSAAYRSHWGPLRALHSLEVAECGVQTTLNWQLTSHIRVAVTSRAHWYTDTIYRHLGDHIDVAPERFAWPDIAQIDLFHVHWPERIAGRDLDEHRRLLERLDQARVPIVWTVHNLEPHEQRDGDDELYALWARAATAAIHHTGWGMARATQRYLFAPGCIHRVISHPHFGHLLGSPIETRADASRRLGFAPCTLRIGVIGAPRRQRDLDRLIDGVLSSDRTDIQLIVFSVDDPASLPDDRRVIAFPREFLTRPAFNRRLATLDAVAFAYFEDQMHGTGVIADAIGAGLPVLTPDWGFATEVLHGAGIPIGSTPEEIGHAIAALDTSSLDHARAKMISFRDRDDPVRVAGEHVTLFDEISAR